MRGSSGESGLQTHPLNFLTPPAVAGRCCTEECEATFHNATALTHPRPKFRPLYVKMQVALANTPCQPSRFRMVTRPRVAKESVVRFRNFHVHIRFPQPLALV